MNDKYLHIIESMRRQTEERMKWPPEKLKAWIKKVHGQGTRELEGKEAEQMLITLKLVGHYSHTNNQRTHTYYYEFNNNKYMVTYGLGDEPLVEEMITDDI